MTTNREANLQLLMFRFERQAAFWNEKLDEVRRDSLWVDPLIESKWIYHPSANPRTRDSALTQIPKAYFRKTFVVDDSTIGGTLQLIGDTQAKVWLNGVELGEVFARRSLSLTVEHQRVKAWSIAGRIKRGTNVLAVEAATYDPFCSAGFNVYGEFSSSAMHTMKLRSDSTWKVSDSMLPGWNILPFNDASWAFSKPFPHPSPVIRPNFHANRLSWIER